MALTDEPKVIIRYPNLSGAIVEVAEVIEHWNGEQRPRYIAGCPACFDCHAPSAYLSTPRTWAAKHSETCRALPQSERAGQ